MGHYLFFFKDVKLTEDVCVCVTSILGEFQRGDPVTDPHLTGSDRIPPPKHTHTHTHIDAHTHRNKRMMGVSKDIHTVAYTGDTQQRRSASNLSICRLDTLSCCFFSHFYCVLNVIYFNCLCV